jgi:acetyl esterase
LNAERLGAQPRGVAVGGDSAGGTLATVATQILCQRGEEAPVAQLLLYPGTDNTDKRYRSQELFGEGFGLTVDEIEWFMRHYARDHDRGDPRISPLHAASLEGLPPAVVAIAGFDPLRDEGLAYADALRAAGNFVRVLVFSGLIHGFANMLAVSPAARSALVETAQAFGTLIHSGRNGSTIQA